jgi:hypothetical protein
VLHIRLSRIAADPPGLDDRVAYIKREARQAVEFRPGSLGISVLADRAEGTALFGSLWASAEAMSASEETEAPLRAELAKQAGTPVAVEDYQVPDEAASDIPGFPDEGGAEIRGVTDYRLVFSSIRNP